MPFRPANLVHTDEGALAESTSSGMGDGSNELGTRSSAGEHSLHTRRVAGSIPAASTTSRRRKPTCLYFVHAPQSGRLKIGIAVDPERRLSALKTGNGEPLTLLGWADYSECHPAELRALESELHACFAPWRLEGEWFEALPDIVKFAHEARDPGTSPEELARPLVEYVDPCRPKIPEGAVAPAGNSRAAVRQRYLLARGLNQ